MSYKTTEKYCENPKCNKRLTLRNNRDVKRKRFCSRTCLCTFRITKLWNTDASKKKLMERDLTQFIEGGTNTRYKKGVENKNWFGGLVEKDCQCCGDKFKATWYQLKNGWGRFCSKGCSKTWYLSNVQKNKKRTGIEVKMAELLTKLGIEFEEQRAFPKQRTVPDFYLPVYNTVLYTDGTYWHRTKRRQFCDARINKRLAKAGYTVLRYWEDDINKNINWVAQDIKTNLQLYEQITATIKQQLEYEQLDKQTSTNETAQKS